MRTRYNQYQTFIYSFFVVNKLISVTLMYAVTLVWRTKLNQIRDTELKIINFLSLKMDTWVLLLVMMCPRYSQKTLLSRCRRKWNI